LRRRIRKPVTGGDGSGSAASWGTFPVPATVKATGKTAAIRNATTPSGSLPRVPSPKRSWGTKGRAAPPSQIEQCFQAAGIETDHDFFAHHDHRHRQP